MGKENKILRLNFEMKITDVVDLNSSFAMGKCLIAYCGENRNKSNISKESFVNALPSLKNVPIVGRYDVEKDEFGGHDIKVINTDKGIKIVNRTIPYGIVPESANQWFKNVEVNGEEKECLFTDIILWKRQYGYEHLTEVGSVGQSMEINISDYSLDSDGICHINQFEFTALCMLEADEPCFEPAKVQIYAKETINTDFKTQYSVMIDELKEISQGINNINFSNETERSIKKVDEKLKILEKYGKSKEDLDFSIDDLSIEELEGKLKEFSNTEGIVVGAKQLFSTGYMEKFNKLHELLKKFENIEFDREGNVISEAYVWFYDYDDNYVMYCIKTWTVEDWTTTQYRQGYTYDQENETYVLSDEKEEMVWELITLEEKKELDSKKEQFATLSNIEKEFDEYKENCPIKEYNRLVEFEAKAIKQQREDSENEIFAKFENRIGETKEFKELVENKANYDLKDLEKECICIVGLYAINEINKETGDEPVTNTSLIYSVIDDKSDDENYYGGLLKKR